MFCRSHLQGSARGSPAKVPRRPNPLHHHLILRTLSPPTSHCASLRAARRNLVPPRSAPCTQCPPPRAQTSPSPRRAAQPPRSSQIPHSQATSATAPTLQTQPQTPKPARISCAASATSPSTSSIRATTPRPSRSSTRTSMRSTPRSRRRSRRPASLLRRLTLASSWKTKT